MYSRILISTILTDINDYNNTNLSQFYNLYQTHLNLLYFCYLFWIKIHITFEREEDGLSWNRQIQMKIDSIIKSKIIWQS
jgi:uncharacterized membrane protein